MNWLMNPIYEGISWVLLRWHQVWSFLLPGDGHFLGTSWEWVMAIVFLVLTVRAVLFPIFVKQIKSQRAMQALAPKIKELQAKYKGDQQTLREEMMKLYQTEKVNPLMGCLPLLLQIPVFFGLFTVLRHINPFAANVNKTQWGWTPEQFDSAAGAQLFTAPIPASFSDNAAHIAALGGAHPAAAKIVAAILVLIMMFTTFVTSRQMIMKTGWQQEPQQRMIQRLMLYGIPFSLLISGWAFPIGVVIYWVTQNLVSLGQQQWVLRKYPPMITAAADTAKTARERAAAATKKQRGAIARFFLVLPPPAKPAGAQPAAKGVWFSRLTGRVSPGKAAVPAAPAEPTPRSLAPRPGAKPRVQPTTPATESTTSETPETEVEAAPAPATATKSFAAPKPATPKATSPKAVPTKAAPAAKAVPTKAAPAKSTAAKAAPAKASPSQATPEEATDATSGVGSGRPGAGGGAARVGGGAGGGRAAAPRKAAPRRKGGQPARKGSGKR
jgi:YidC/Oxa1 family membrane protein insertase